MKTTPKVSLLIPVFNMEQFLRRALDSACNQTLRDIEIICVDDASTDRSAAILADYASRDERIRILRHERNRGLLATRETAVLQAKGEYVMHLDADDALTSDIVEKSYLKARETAADIVHFSALIFSKTNPEGKLLNWASPKQKDTLLQPEMTHQLLLGQIGHNCWGKLFRRSLYCRGLAEIGAEMMHKNLTYEEDLLQCSVIFSLAKKYVVLDTIGYHYHSRDESESNKIYDNSEQLKAAMNDYFTVVRFLNRYLKKPFLSSLSAASIPPFSYYIGTKDLLQADEFARILEVFLEIYDESERWLVFAYLFDQHREKIFESLTALNFPQAKPMAPSGKRRIAFVLPNRTEPYLLSKTIELANGLAAKGDERIALIITDPIQTKLRPIAENVEIFTVHEDSHRRIKDLYDLLGRESFEVIVHADLMSLRTYDDVVLFKLLGNRVVLMDHHSYLRNIHTGNPNFNGICRKLYAICDGIVCGQRFDESLWKSWVSPRAVTIPKPVDPNLATIRPVASGKTRNLILAGPFEQNFHRQHLAIEMFPRVLSRFPDARLQLVGPLTDEGYVRWCINRMETLKIEKAVQILGSHVNLSDIYANAALNIMTSSFESEDEPFIFAKAYGLPTVLFRLDSLDLARTEDCIAVEKDSPSAMADAIINLLARADIYEDLSRKARENLPKISLESVLDRWSQLFMALTTSTLEECLQSEISSFDEKILLAELLNEENFYLPVIIDNNRRLAAELDRQEKKFQEDLKVEQAKQEMLNATIASLEEKLKAIGLNRPEDNLQKSGKIRSLFRSFSRKA